MSNWQRLRQVLFRPIPHGIFCWRYFFPGQSSTVKRHRQVFLNTLFRKPRVVWGLIVVMNYLLWYLWFAWRKVFSVWRVRSRTSTLISSIRELQSLFWLAYGYGVPPHNYYRYQLYRYSSRDWLEFVFNHELPQWHLVASPDITDDESRLLNDKLIFAETMARYHLPAVETFQVFVQDELLSSAWLFQQRSLFFKPLTGNQKRGCYTLYYHSDNDEYQLVGDEEAASQNEIVAVLQRQFNQQSYLCQPLLQNHDFISQIAPDLPLVTIRVITLKKGMDVGVISAVMEVAETDTANNIIPVYIESTDGVLEKPLLIPENMNNVLQELFSLLDGKVLPWWSETLEVVIRAHGYFPNVTSIGWDIAITPEGVKLIEGNFNWAVAPHQLTGKAIGHCW